MKKKTIILTIISIVFLTAIFLYVMFLVVNTKQYIKIKDSFTSMDTYIEIQIESNDEVILKKEVENVKNIYDTYHKISDRYKDYENVNNIKTINDNAGIKEVKVTQELFDLISFSVEANKRSEHINVAAGSLLELWHLKREEGLSIPTESELNEAKQHMNIEDVVLNKENLTVFLKDSKMSLDLGAISKGYTTEIVGKYLESKNLNKYLINAGGNIKAGSSLENRSSWNIGIRDPLSEDSFVVLNIKNKSIVTSGDYQRTYTVNGVKYHHIIDLKTLYPSSNFHSVTVITADSGYADALSTTFFIMSLEEGQEFLKTLNDVEVIWYGVDLKITYSLGAEKYVSKEK